MAQERTIKPIPKKEPGDRMMIGVPCLDHIKTPTVTSLFAGTANLSMPAQLNIRSASLVHDARNKIVERAIEQGATHLMFVDSDIVFPDNGIQKLYEQDKDIIGGLYFRKIAPHYPTFSQLTGKTITFPTTFPKSKPFKVFGIGTGFLMIKVSVLKKIADPWFYFGEFHGQKMGEDIYFCNKARKAGFEAWCDPTIPLQHVGEYGFDLKDYELYQKDKPGLNPDEVWDMR